MNAIFLFWLPWEVFALILLLYYCINITFSWGKYSALLKLGKHAQVLNVACLRLQNNSSSSLESLKKILMRLVAFSFDSLTLS